MNHDQDQWAENGLHCSLRLNKTPYHLYRTICFLPDIRLIPLVPMVIFTVNLELLQPGLMVCHIKCLAGFEIVYQFLTTDQTTSLVNTQIEK